MTKVLSSETLVLQRDVSSLAGYVRGFGGKRVLVIGDMVADEYIVGKPARISREAPVLVLHHSEEFLCPGGAANVAYNLAALGAETYVAGVIGDDVTGAQLTRQLMDLNIGAEGLLTDPDRPTATKTRVVGRGEQEIQQQIVRIDRVDTSNLEDSLSGKLVDAIHSLLPRVDGIVISDYENGVISPGVLEAILPLAKQNDLVIAVDSHGDLFRFKGVTVATPNQPEAEATLHRHIESQADLEQAGDDLIQGMGARGVLLTRGSKGMSLFEQNEPPYHLPPANLKEVFDPSGAGDTACAVFTLALLAGASMRDAAVLSNIAAGEVVKKLGAATIGAADLEEAVRQAAV